MKNKTNKNKIVTNEITIIVVEPITPDNISAICRLMKNFNFKNLILIKPKFKIEDLKYEIARKGYDLCKKIKVYENFKRVRKEYKILISTTAKQGKKITREYLNLEELKSVILKKVVEEKNNILEEKNIGILFGREDKGLLQKEIEESDILITIETEKEQRALNLSHTVGIILYYFYNHIFKEIEEKTNNKIKEERLQKKAEVAEERQKEVLIKKILSLYKEYSKKNNNYNREKEETQRIVWKRILGKNFITKKEIKTLLGFIKEIEKEKKIIKNNKKNKRRKAKTTKK